MRFIGRSGVSLKETIAYNIGVVKATLHGPSRVGCLLFAQRKKITTILAGIKAPAARAVKFDVVVTVDKIKFDFEEYPNVNLVSVARAGKFAEPR